MGKLFKCFAKSKRGVSTVIGVVFFALVILMGSSLIIWEITQHDAYMQVASERDRLDWEKQNEIIEIESASIFDGKLSASVINKGAVTAHLVDLWITEYSSTTANWRRVFPINYYLNPGNTTTNIGQDLETPELDPERTYVIKIVTERGNIATTIFPEPSEVTEYVMPHSWIDIGILRFYFDYYSLNFTSEYHHDPSPAWVVPGKEKIMFYVKIVNTGKHPITLRKYCVFYAMEYREGSPGSSQNSYGLFIVSPDSEYPGHNQGEGKMYPYDEVNSPYVLQPNPEEQWWLGGPPVILKFGSEYTADDKPVDLERDCVYLISIGLFYYYTENGEEHQYGQNIPFVAIRTLP